MTDVMSFMSMAVQNVDTTYAPIHVLAGDDVTAQVTGFRTAVDLGPGLAQHGQKVMCLNSGVLRYRAPAHYYIEDAYVKHYYPKLEDKVIGVIEDRGGDVYKVNIFAGSAAVLSRLAFQGATKRNRPDLKRGDLVYCRVSDTDPDADVALTCISAAGVKKDWQSGEAIYGALVGGIMLRLSIAYANSLLRPDILVLNLLGQRMSFEVAIGMNGCVWLKAATPLEMIILRNAIVSSEAMDDTSVTALVSVLLQRLAKR